MVAAFFATPRYLLLLIFLLSATWVGRCSADELWGELESGFSMTLPVYFWARELNVHHDSVLNPENIIASIPSSVQLLEARPELFQHFRSFSINIKPRFRVENRKFDSAGMDDESDSDAFVNEAGVQFAASDSVFLSYGREVLMWGPSLFLSTSNPFFVNNGRSDPFSELSGRDFAKITHIVNSSLTMIYIHNGAIGEDVEQAGGFDPISALKIDYVGDTYYSSLIISKEASQNLQLGGYFGITASSALLLYTEASLSKGSKAFYPVRNAAPSGWEMAATSSSNRLNTNLLAGLGYTFLNGLTLNAEYVYNPIGYDDDQAKDYFELARDASQQFLLGGSPALLGAANLTNLQLLRQNYLFTQVNYPDSGGRFDWTVRYARNLDDKSESINASVTWSVNDNTNLFFLGTINNGKRTTEYGSYIESLAQVGVTYFLW